MYYFGCLILANELVKKLGYGTIRSKLVKGDQMIQGRGE